MFDNSHNEEDNVTVGKEVKYDIKVGFLNMNSLSADCKIEYILWYYECLQLDVLFLSDTRLSKLQVDLLNNVLIHGWVQTPKSSLHSPRNH